jgi:hypothetical protein
MKKTCNYFLLSLIMLVQGTAITAQNYMNAFNARYFIQPGISLDDDTAILRLNEYRIEAMLPLFKLSNGSAFGIRPQFKSISLRSSDPAREDLHIYSVKLPVFGFIQWRESKWSSYVDVSPKLNSDFRNIGGRHFQIGGMILNYYQRKKDFYWQFGLFYNQDAYGPFFMPLVGLDWKLDDLNYIAVLLPTYMIYERKLSPKLYAGIEIELTGETYRLGGSGYTNSFISQVGENKLTFLTEPRLFIDYYISPHWVLYAKPGFRLFQKYEHFTRADVRIPDSEYVEGVLKNNFYVELGFAMRFRYDEDPE